MKANQLATLVLRLLGIYCLINVIPLFSIVPMAVSFAHSESVDGRSHILESATLLMASILPFIFNLTAGILLLVLSRNLGERLAPPETTERKIEAVSFEQMQVLAFAAAGILIFASALPQLLNSLSNLAHWALAGRDSSQRQNIYSVYSSREIMFTVGIIAKAILGLMLFFRARGFANFWRSLRTYGTPHPPQS